MEPHPDNPSAGKAPLIELLNSDFHPLFLSYAELLLKPLGNWCLVDM